MTDTNVTKDAATKTLVIERLIDSPRERVWQVWTDPEMLAEWWGPRGWKTTIKTFEFKPGGVWHYGMECQDESQSEWFGKTAWGKAVYEDINEFNSFTYKDYFSDEDGNISDEMPVATVTMEFIETDSKTRLLSTSVFDTVEGYDKVLAMGVVEGVSQTWDRMEELLADGAGSDAVKSS
jgi:uncharacterized protein YndB with AHSA1/START domain